MNPILHENKVYLPQQAGPWSGVKEVEVTKAPPAHRWTGSKIPVSLVQQVLAFFEWSMQETRSETLVDLFYSEEHGWKAVVLPQEGYTNMTVKRLEDHPNRIPTYQEHCRGYTPMGTWHHHCSSAAFASGVDQHDEKSKEGIHLTTGNLNSAQYSVHARASFRHTVTPVHLADWFECSDAIAPHLRSQQIEYMLCQPATGITFPDWWKANVIKVERALSVVSTGYCGTQNYSSGYDRTATRKGWLDTRVGALMRQYDVQESDVLDIIKQLREQDLVKDVIDCMIWAELPIDDCFEHLGGKEVEEEADEIDEMVAAQTGHMLGCNCPTCCQVRLQHDDEVEPLEDVRQYSGCKSTDPECRCADCTEIRAYYAQ